MPKFIGALAALVALVAAVLGKIEPLDALQRAVIAFGLGWGFGLVWHAICSVLPKASSTNEGASGEPESVT